MIIKLCKIPSLEWVNENYIIDLTTKAIFDEKRQERISPVSSFKSGKYVVYLRDNLTGNGKEVPLETIKESLNALSTPKKGWIMGALENGYVTISSNPFIFTKEEEVNKALESLATKNQGKTYVKLKVESFVTAGGVKWE